MIVDFSALVAMLPAKPGFERLNEAIAATPEVMVPAPCYLEVAW